MKEEQPSNNMILMMVLIAAAALLLIILNPVKTPERPAVDCDNPRLTGGGNGNFYVCDENSRFYHGTEGVR